jgi:hypothetical protein
MVCRMPARFVVARNPDEASTLPYLLRVPVAGPPLRLKAKATWPRTAKVYCHQVDHGREHRSQFVFVTLLTGPPRRG